MATEIAINVEVTTTLPAALLQKVEKLALEMDLSINELIQVALEDFIKQEQPFSVWRAQIAEAYADYPAEDERMWEAAMTDDMQRILKEDEENR